MKSVLLSIYPEWCKKSVTKSAKIKMENRYTRNRSRFGKQSRQYLHRLRCISIVQKARTDMSGFIDLITMDLIVAGYGKTITLQNQCDKLVDDNKALQSNLDMYILECLSLRRQLEELKNENK